MMSPKIAVLFLLLTSIFTALSQECFNYHQQNCNPKPSKFIYQEHLSSVSFLFSSGEIREIPFTLLLGKDYRITLCADAVFNNVIKLTILNEQRNEIYNNSSRNFNLNMEFSCRKTQEAIFVVEAPGPHMGKDETLYFEGCIGLLIEEMVSVKTGF